jgi:exodeoxyribonuclease VII large subunit
MQSAEVFTISVSEFVGSVNQLLQQAYPYIDIEGELSNLRVSKNKWVYFDLKDEAAQVKCFATVYAVSGLLEDGMLVRISGSPRLHPHYNFSVTVQRIVPVGKGALRRSAELLQAKLSAEGLFDNDRKRALPAVPCRIALITAATSAAYADFIKIAAARWPALVIDHYDVLVQGDNAPVQIVAALAAVNQQPELTDAVVVIRGGGSTEDLAAFNDEQVVRAVAASRTPTLVAIGHEIDTSLAELAADCRASTPSNAAELLLPDQSVVHRELQHKQIILSQTLQRIVARRREDVGQLHNAANVALQHVYARSQAAIMQMRNLLAAYNPRRPLQQGYALVTHNGTTVRTVAAVQTDDMIAIEFIDGSATAAVQQTNKKGTSL